MSRKNFIYLLILLFLSQNLLSMKNIELRDKMIKNIKKRQEEIKKNIISVLKINFLLQILNYKP